jgi:hypothetical protein
VAFPGGNNAIVESQQKPIGDDGWSTTGVNWTEDLTFTLYAIALCFPNVRSTAVAPTPLSESQKVVERVDGQRAASG